MDKKYFLYSMLEEYENGYEGYFIRTYKDLKDVSVYYSYDKDMKMIIEHTDDGVISHPVALTKEFVASSFYKQKLFLTKEYALELLTQGVKVNFDLNYKNINYKGILKLDTKNPGEIEHFYIEADTRGVKLTERYDLIVKAIIKGNWYL